MTMTGFIAKSTFRNRRRSALTIISISFSLLLLTLMMTIWRSFYLDQGTPESARRLITRHKVSMNFFLPESYREKIRFVPGVEHVVPFSWFGGKYIDDKPEHFFVQFATDPEILDVHREWIVDTQQVEAWKRDRAGALVSSKIANKYGWKVGDRVTLEGTIFPLNLELTIRAIYEPTDNWDSLFFHKEYLEEAVPWFKGQADTFAVLVDSPENVSRVSQAIDDEFRNSPQPTKTETEKAFQVGFVAMLGNVKAFILGISAAVVFAILLVSANTMAMSIRERIREVAVLKTLGFTRRRILTLFVGEAVALALIGGSLGIVAATGLVRMVANSPQGGMLGDIRVTVPTLLIALGVAALVGFLSGIIPSYRAAQLDIAEGLRHTG
jgi:putative ABC transport system permease protein